MSYIGNQPTQVAFVTDTFSGNSSTTAFTMSVAPANTASALVAITGVVQDPSTYSVNGTTLTFSAAPPTGTGNISVRYLGIPASGVTTTAYRTVTDSTATAGQTSFTIPSYTVGYLNVYRNGVRLAAADYTATTGTTVVLAVGATAGDTITTESFYVSSVLNAIPATNASVQQTYLASGVAGTGPAVWAWANAITQNLTYAAVNIIQLNAESSPGFDTNSCFDTSTYKFTPNVAGYYMVSGAVGCGGFVTGGQYIPAIAKNGTIVINGAYSTGVTGNYVIMNVVGLIYMNGTTDYLQLAVFDGQASGTKSVNSGSGATYMMAYLARAA